MPTRSARRQASDALEQAFLVNLIAELEAQEYESVDSDSDSLQRREVACICTHAE